MLAFGLALLLTGCREVEPSPNPPASPVPALATPTYTATEAAFAANLNPWLGLPSDDPQIASRPALAYAIELDPAAPQVAGLQAMEWVVEMPPAPASDGSMPAESWSLVALTRRLASARPALGPVGKAEGLHLAAASSFGSSRLLAGSADPEIAAAFARSGITLTLLSAEAPPSAAEGIDAAMPGLELRFVAEAPEGEPASALTLPHAVDRATVWRLDPILGLWTRYYAVGEQLEPVRDADTGEPLSAANLLLLQVEGEPGAEGWWTGEGEATLLRDGIAIAGRWARRGTGDRLSLTDARGTPLALRPGNSWMLLTEGDAPRAIRP